MAVKLNMSKAYDRVEWAYLEAIMRRMGFEEKWIRIIMLCVSSVSYYVLMNDILYGNIHPTHELRQANPLSPYLFLLMAEGLSSLQVWAELDERVTRVPIAAGGIQISHLPFANDSLLFFARLYSLNGGIFLGNCIHIK